jgi:hypothetical protein
MTQRRIRGERVGRTWAFYALEEGQEIATIAAPIRASAHNIRSALMPGMFEEFARRTLRD